MEAEEIQVGLKQLQIAGVSGMGPGSWSAGWGGGGRFQLWDWRFMTTRGEQAIMFRKDIFNPLAHGLNGEFHNSMFRKRFPCATTLALSSLIPTVEEGDGGRPEEE